MSVEKGASRPLPPRGSEFENNLAEIYNFLARFRSAPSPQLVLWRPTQTEGGRANTKRWPWKEMLAATVVLPALSGVARAHNDRCREGRIAMSRRFKSVALSTVSLAVIVLGTPPVSATSSC